MTANINVHLEHRYKKLILTSPIGWGTQEDLLSFDIATHHSKPLCLQPHSGYLLLNLYDGIQGKRAYQIVKAINNDAGPPLDYSINQLIFDPYMRRLLG